MKYKVRITELLVKEIEVDVENHDEAISKAKEMYDKEQIVLDYKDLKDTTFSAYPENTEDLFLSIFKPNKYGVETECDLEKDLLF